MSRSITRPNLIKCLTTRYITSVCDMRVASLCATMNGGVHGGVLCACERQRTAEAARRANKSASSCRAAVASLPLRTNSRAILCTRRPNPKAAEGPVGSSPHPRFGAKCSCNAPPRGPQGWQKVRLAAQQAPPRDSDLCRRCTARGATAGCVPRPASSPASCAVRALCGLASSSPASLFGSLFNASPQRHASNNAANDRPLSADPCGLLPSLHAVPLLACALSLLAGELLGQSVLRYLPHLWPAKPSLVAQLWPRRAGSSQTRWWSRPCCTTR